MPSSGLSPSSPRCVPATLRARMLHGSACDRPVRDESTVVHAIAPELQRGDRNTIHAHDAPSAPDLARSGHIQHGIGRLTPTSAPGSRARTTVSRDYPSCGSQISRSWTRPLTLDPSATTSVSRSCRAPRIPRRVRRSPASVARHAGAHPSASPSSVVAAP